MFEIIIETAEFKGLSIVKQHRMINEVKIRHSRSELTRLSSEKKCTHK